MAKHTRKVLYDPSVLVTVSELAEAVGIEMDTVNNWLRRGIINRAPIGGRQLRNRLFSTEEVYRAALTSELVNLGIAPSHALNAVDAIWEELDHQHPPDYVIAFQHAGRWSAVPLARNLMGGPLQTTLEKFPNRAFAVLSISNLFAEITDKLANLS
jgi:hypothetical protein